MTSPRTAQPTDPVTRIMTTSVATIDAGASWAQALAELVGNQIGAVVLIDDNERIGLVSERDLIYALAQGEVDAAAARKGRAQKTRHLVRLPRGTAAHTHTFS